jgi:ATP-dependent helicase/nuclease subunit A
VLIADYKTDRPAPRSLQEVPRGYLCQLALYRAVLARMCPGRAIRVALIFTDVPDLMEPSPEILDAEIAGLTSL